MLDHHWRRFKRLCGKLGIEGASPHTFRHTTASWLVMSGVDLPTVSKILGHTDIKTTMIYAHLAKEHVAKAVARLDFDTEEAQLRHNDGSGVVASGSLPPIGSSP